DYFKEEAIVYAWDLLTKVYDLSQERILITVFGGSGGGAGGVPPDDDARALWRKVTGFSDERILGLPGMPGDNFWQMGETGPCGPCTELHWFNGDISGGVPYGRFGDEARLTALPKPCVDTGAGLERMASVLQGVTSNYDTDALRGLVEKVSEISGK